MNYDGFLNAFPSGTVLNNYSGECVSLIANYLDFNGLHGSIAYANAKDWANHPAMRGEFDWVENNPSDFNQVPKRGDIIVWSGSLPGSGGYGHIAIWDRVVSPGLFASYDNNWGGRYCHFVTHNWNYVLGWWTRKASAPAQPSGGGEEMIANQDQATKMYQMLRPNGSASPEEINGSIGKRSFVNFLYDAQPEIAARDKFFRDQQAQVANQQNVINQLNQAVTEITGRANATKAEKDAALSKVAELLAQLTEETDKLKDAQKQLEELKNQQVPVQDEKVVVTNWLKKLWERLFK